MYRIVSLQAENVMKLKAVSITPDGNIITLTGKNAAGKSSVMNAIAMTLGGEKLVPEKPIRDGQKSAKITVDLGDMTVTRRFTAAGSEVTIRNKEGAIQSGPQGILNKIVGKLAFDPLAFATMEPKPQLDTLRAMVGLDFTALNKKRQEHYDARTLVNRDLEATKVKLNATTLDEQAPAEEVSAAELSAELERINTHNQGITDKESDLNTLKNDLDEARTKSITKKTELEAAQLAYQTALDEEETCQGSYNTAKAEVEKLVKEDPEPVREKIKTADETNRKVRANQEHARLKKELEGYEKSSKAYTQKIEAIDADKEDQLAKAKFPLKELSFDESGVVFKGNPFSQASDAEKLRTSVAIGMAMNPTLRVMFVRNGSLLDANGLKLIAEMAESKEFQVWIEDARSTDPAAITIEDGQIAE